MPLRRRSYLPADDEGTTRGFTVASDDPVATRTDLLFVDDWQRAGLDCLLVECTEYTVGSRPSLVRSGRGAGELEEQETYYRGFVHAPGVTDPYRSYSDVWPQSEPTEDGWVIWDERASADGFPDKSLPGEDGCSLAKHAVNLLADGLSEHLDSIAAGTTRSRFTAGEETA